MSMKKKLKVNTQSFARLYPDHNDKFCRERHQNTKHFNFVAPCVAGLEQTTSDLGTRVVLLEDDVSQIKLTVSDLVSTVVDQDVRLVVLEEDVEGGVELQEIHQGAFSYILDPYVYFLIVCF